MGRGHGHDGAPVLKLLALPGALTTLRLCQALNPPMLAAPAAQAPSLRVAVNVLEGGIVGVLGQPAAGGRIVQPAVHCGARDIHYGADMPD